MHHYASTLFLYVFLHVVFPTFSLYRMQSHRWYKPEEHKDLLVQWISETADVIERTLHCIDVFGASGRVSKTWERAGYSAESFDVKLSPRHDLCSEQGFKTLMTLGLKNLKLSI